MEIEQLEQISTELIKLRKDIKEGLFKNVNEMLVQLHDIKQRAEIYSIPVVLLDASFIEEFNNKDFLQLPEELDVDNSEEYPEEY